MIVNPVITIDPGEKGAVAFGTTLANVTVVKIPNTLTGMADLARSLRETGHRPTCFFEYNTGFMSGLGKTDDEGNISSGVSTKAMYSFGRNTGHVEMAFVAAGIPVCRVVPIKWQSAAGVRSPLKSVMTPAQWKNHLKAKSQEKFPHLRVTLVNADALLIYYAAVTGRLKHVTNLQ